MLKTYRIIPLVFILFLFGFTLITVAPVFAQGQWDKSMGMRHPDRPCMIVNSCGVDGRSPAQIASDPFDTGVHSPMPTSTSPSGGEVAELNAKISGLEAGLTELKGVVMALQEQSKNSMQPVAPTAPSGGEAAGLNAKISGLEARLGPLEKELANITAGRALAAEEEKQRQWCGQSMTERQVQQKSKRARHAGTGCMNMHPGDFNRYKATCGPLLDRKYNVAGIKRCGT